MLIHSGKQYFGTSTTSLNFPLDPQPTLESNFQLVDKVAYLVVCHYHVGVCRCNVIRDNLFQGNTAVEVLKELISTFSKEGSWIIDLTGRSGELWDISMLQHSDQRKTTVIIVRFLDPYSTPTPLNHRYSYLWP